MPNRTIKKENKMCFTYEEFHEALKIADEIMKRNNGHTFETILKTRCVYCRKSPKVKTRCGAWFQTFINKLEYVLLNFESIKAERNEKGN